MQVYEVEVEPNKSRGQKFYSAVRGWISSWNDPDQIKMLHFETRTQEQARIKGEKFGHVRSVRKANIDRLRGNPEHTKLDVIPDKIQLDVSYNKAVAMDEMVWIKRQKRRGSMVKEKEKIFSE